MDAIPRIVRTLSLALLLAGTVHAQWVQVNTGLSNPSGLFVHSLGLTGTSILAGTEDGVYLSTNNGASWTGVTPTDQSITRINCFGTKGPTLFAGANSKGVYRSTNSGASWVYAGLSLSPNVHAFTASSTMLFAGTWLYGAFRSTDDGANWTPVNNGLANTNGNANVYALTMVGTNLFAGTDGRGIFSSTDNGTNWSAVNNGLTSIYVNALAVIGTNLFAGTADGGVCLSTNSGTSWTAVNAGLTNISVNAFAVIGTNLFAGTGGGVFLSTNNGTSWTAVNTGLTFTPVNALAVTGANLFAGNTNANAVGGGVWRRPLSEMLPMAPASTTNAATSVGQTNAIVNGSVNPNGIATTAWFEWGTSSTLTTATSTAPQSVGAGSIAVNVAQAMTSLASGSTYYFRILAQNGGGTSLGSILPFMTIPNAPSAVTGTNISITGFTANWSAVAGATSYRLDVGTDIGFVSFVSGYNNVAVGNVTGYPVTGLALNTPYYYRVRATNAGGTSSSSNTITTSTLPNAPGSPTALAGTNASASGFRANWSTAAGATSYRLDVATDNGFASFVSGYNNLATGNVTNNTVTGLTANTPYYYRVRAANAGGTSSSSNTVTIATLPGAPGSPTALAGSNASTSGFTANWSAAAGATSYRLDVARDNGFASFVSGYNNLAAGNVTGYAVTGLTANTPYYYRVRAANAGGTSGSSNTMTTSTLPNAPVGWVQINTGLTGTGVVQAFASNSTNLFAGTLNGGVFVSTNNGANWTQGNSGLTKTEVRSLAVNGANLFAGIGTATGGGGVYVSTNNCGSWAAAHSGLTNPNILSLAFSGGNLFAGTWGFGVYRSTNNGTSWTAVNAGFPNTNVAAFAVIGTYLFAGTSGAGVLRTTDNGANWVAVNSGLTSIAVNALAASGTNLFAATGDGLFHSTNNGTSWTKKAGYPYTSVLALATTGNNLFASTYPSVWLSTNSGASWIEVNAGLPGMSISVLAVSGTNLFAGTDGGAWRRPLSEMITSVPYRVHEIPGSLALEQNYPNPFNPSTTIRYGLPGRLHVMLIVFNILGQPVTVLQNGEQEAGYHEVRFDATGLASGVYFYRIKAGDIVQTRRLSFLR